MFFSRQPPLPRRAAIESTPIPAGDEKLTALIQKADIIYFSSESLGPSGGSEGAWKLIEVLKRDGGRFAIGWDAINGEDQPLLDQWVKEGISADAVVARLHLEGATVESEVARRFFREANRYAAQILALRYSPETRATTSESGSLVSQEIFPGFEPPPGDFEGFKQRLPSSTGTSEAKLRVLYDAALLREQFAAARIARYFRENRGEKILAFVPEAQLGSNHGVPYFVAQKTRARQLVLYSKSRSTSRARLLAQARFFWRPVLGRGRFEVVNCSPFTAGDLP
jgi:hypothetical protein